MPNTREKLIELITDKENDLIRKIAWFTDTYRIKEVADHLIANGVTLDNQVSSSKWIPVSEPPKERGCYLISVTHWLDGKPVTREAKWNGADWLSCYRKEEITPRVTHWMPMPMPQPLKGE
jgi:hypothetical protein